MTLPLSTADSSPPDARRWIAFAVVLAAGFMDLLDVTIVNVALPSLQTDLKAEYSQLAWIVAAYVVSFAAVLITGGRLGDIYGRKRIFLVGMVGFTLASLACGISTSPSMLIGSRFVQGVFAALMVPQILATIRVTFPKDERGKAIALYGGVSGSASAVGLSLGGLLVQADLFGLSWRPIFLVNVPVGVIALVAAAAVMRDSRSAAAPRLDVLGMVLAITAVLLLVYPLTEGRRLHWPAWTFAMMAAAAVVFVAFIAYERWRTRTSGSPLIDLALFRSRPFTVGLVAWMLFWIGFGGFFLVWTLFMQEGLGWTPMRAGLTAVFFAVGAGMGAGLSANTLAPKFGRRVLVAGGLVTITGLYLYSVMTAHYEGAFASWQMIFPLVVTGLGFGAVLAPTIDLLLGQVPAHEAGSASGVLSAAQQLGLALGVALVGVVFFTQLDHDSARGTDAVTPQARAELAAQGLPESAQDTILANFRACVTDRSAQVDPTAVPESCRVAPAKVTPAVAQTLSDAGKRANTVNFAHTFAYTLWFGVALMVLVSIGFLALPKDARTEHHELDEPDDELVRV
ncbi:MFS transporter [Nocardia sp. BSTN01]|uniref:MFS transporter n=1 Tax=Nocardia sp. BSTN01 TaxID=2783665 RepID=UPI00188F33D3|nr:MFS transporter [Nocardia sp. BSTN01]MBF4997633.1 MFS transporter [Nocardia sp. BSTN01]